MIADIGGSEPQKARHPGRPRYRREDFDHSPLVVFYEVTQACDLACLHCRACAQSNPHPNELSREESFGLISQLAEFPKPPLLVLTGGDPLKRPDIYDLVEHAAHAGLEIAVTPSATPLVTRAAIRRLRDAGMRRLAISLDGADADTHDEQRGIPGIFNRTLDILSWARSDDIPTQVNTTITRRNVSQIEAMADLLATLRIVMWSVFYLVPVGRATEAGRLRAEQYEASFEQLWRQMQRQPYAIKTTEAPHFRRYLLQHSKDNGQPAGRSQKAGASSSGMAPLGVNDGKGVMFISHTGLIHPSGFMPIVCGLYPLDNVVRVYQRSPIFRGLRDTNRLEGKCGACEYRNICGGSRARAYALSGNPYAEEPDCIYLPPAFAEM